MFSNALMSTGNAEQLAARLVRQEAQRVN